MISGRFVDEKGKDWWIGQSYGHAHTGDNGQRESTASFSLTRFWNKHRPNDVSIGPGGSFSKGEGGYEHAQMLFPTPSTFVIQGMMPGKTTISFSPKKEGQEVVEILHDGRNVKESGIETEPGQEIKDLRIVIAKR